MQLFLKILSELANSVDPDQTAPSEAVWCESTLFAYVNLLDHLVFEILGHLRYPPHIVTITTWLKYFYSYCKPQLNKLEGLRV